MCNRNIALFLDNVIRPESMHFRIWVRWKHTSLSGWIGWSDDNRFLYEATRNSTITNRTLVSYYIFSAKSLNRQCLPLVATWTFPVRVGGANVDCDIRSNTAASNESSGQLYAMIEMEKNQCRFVLCKHCAICHSCISVRFIVVCMCSEI